MGGRQRFARIKVLQRGGDRVAQLHDTDTGRDLFVTRRNGTYVHWDRHDSPVANVALRTAAAVALGHGTKDRAVTGRAPRPASPIDIPKRTERPCKRCEVPFLPKSPGSKICPTCRSAAGMRQTAEGKAKRIDRAAVALVAAASLDQGGEEVRGLASDDLIALGFPMGQVIEAERLALEGQSADQIAGHLAEFKAVAA